MYMNNRRTMLGIATAFYVGFRAKAQTPKRVPAKELARYELTGPQAGLEAVLVDVTAMPGASSTAHRHPGFVLGYVLDGEMQFAINGGEPQIVKTGGTFFEPAGALHTTGGSAKADAPVRFLAFMVVPKGSPTVVPAA
jgi:quercetin dioxygenase-like cupin family protein